MVLPNYKEIIIDDRQESTRRLIKFDKLSVMIYGDAKKILLENEKLVNILSEALIERETLTKEEIESLVTTGKIAENLEPLKEGETSLLKLREIAKAKKIKGYSKMTKEELEEAIEKGEE